MVFERAGLAPQLTARISQSGDDRPAPVIAVPPTASMPLARPMGAPMPAAIALQLDLACQGNPLRLLPFIPLNLSLDFGRLGL
jgi:hypothetical protein